MNLVIPTNCKLGALAWKMQAIYNYPVYDDKGNLRNVCLGPYLHCQWNRSDKWAFHEEYRKVWSEFKCLLDMRDEGKWRRTFAENEKRLNISAFQIEFAATQARR